MKTNLAVLTAASTPDSLRTLVASGRICANAKRSRSEEPFFETAYGVLIKELRLLARSIFIIDKDDVIRYVRIVPEQTNEPDYEDAINALNSLL